MLGEPFKDDSKLWQKKLTLQEKLSLGVHNSKPIISMELVKKGKFLKYKRFYRFYHNFIACYKSEEHAKGDPLKLKSVLIFDHSIQAEWVYKCEPSSITFDQPYIHQFQVRKTLSFIKLTKLENKTMLIPPSDSEKLEKLRDYFQKRLTLKNYYQNYKDLQELGKGKYSTVFLTRSSESFKTYAVKVINKQKERLSEREFNLIKNEIKILSFLNHPNIVELKEVFQSESTVHIVLEHLKGMSLQSLIKSGRKFSAKEVASILKGLLNALCYLKQKNIIHRDIKPDNILLRSEKISVENVCLVDFGFSTYLDHSGFLSIKCGTPGFVAPEVLQLRSSEKLPFTPACDIFAVGILFHILLFGKSPFRAANYKDMINLNKECKIDFDAHLYAGAPKCGLDLLKSLLERDPSRRITVEEALLHPFIVNFSKEVVLSKDKVITNHSSINTTLVFNNNTSSEELNPEKSNHNCELMKEGSSPPEAITSLAD